MQVKAIKHAQSMSKWPSGSAYVGNFIDYLFCLAVAFPRGLCIVLEGGSTFLPLMLSMYINRLGLFSYLYRTLLSCLSICLGSWVSSTTLCMGVGQYCTIAVTAWCSAHQLPGCECIGNRSCAPLGHQNGQYMGIYGHMQPYIHAFTCIYKL